MNQASERDKKGRPQRWEQGLMELAERRGDTAAIGQRAACLARNMNFAPWIALAVAEQQISLRDAHLLDRASRCKELQAGVLDKKLTLAQLRVTMPYAPYLLAAELMPAMREGDWTMRELAEVFKAILKEERSRDSEGDALPVRIKATSEYMGIANKMVAVMKETRCGLSMALDMALGRLTVSFVREYAAHRRLLDRESRERLMEDRFGRRAFDPNCGAVRGMRSADRSIGPAGTDRRPGERSMRPVRRDPGRDSRARTSRG